MGRSGSGKSRFLECILGRNKPAIGAMQGSPVIVSSGRESLSWRFTPQGLAKRLAGKHRSAGFAEALTACGLWDVRKEPLPRLSPSQSLACECLPLLLLEANLLVSDCGLDELDPWTIASVSELIGIRVAAGASSICSTMRPDIAERQENLLLLRKGSIVFAGPVQDFVRRSSPSQLVVEANDPSTVKSLVEAFDVEVVQSGDRFEISTPNGQEVAAKLLTHGYGSVRIIHMKQPTLADALQAID